MKVRIPWYPDSIHARAILPTRNSVFVAFAVVVCSIGIAGCMLSVAPIFPYSEHVFEPRLLGTWVSDDGKSRAVIESMTEDTYSIRYEDEGGMSRLGGRLGVLDGRLVLDVWPVPGEEEIPQTYAELMIQGHFPIVLDLAGDEIRVSTFEAEAFSDAIEDGIIDVPHATTGDRLLLRGDSDEVRAALTSYLSMKGVMEDDGVWRRVRD